MAAISAAKTRSTSAALRRRAIASPSATAGDSGSISSAPRRTPLSRSSRRARWSVKRSIRSRQGKVRGDHLEGGHHPLVLAIADTASNSASRSAKCWKTVRSETPARPAIRSDVGPHVAVVEQREQGVHHLLAGALGASGPAVLVAVGTRQRRLFAVRLQLV